MSVKKILLLSAASVAAVAMTVAQAGGPTMEPTAPVADNGYYIEGHVGYANQNYYDDQNWVAATGGTNTITNNQNNSNTKGGFSGGVDAGYKINKNYGVELGWFSLPSVDVANSGGTARSPVWLTSWVLYLAGKYMMPIGWMNSTDLFFKLGAAYRHAQVSTTDIVTGTSTLLISKGNSDYVRPMFATGLDYSFSDAWSGILQYTYFMGANNSFPFSAANTGALGTVAANVFTLGLGYKFTV